MKDFVYDFLSFSGINLKLSWLGDYLFWLSLILSVPVRLVLIPDFQTHIIANFNFLLNQLLLIAIPEEIFFRGFLMSLFAIELKRKIFIFSYSNIAAAIVFSIFHLFIHDILWSASVFIPALVYGYFREKHDSVLPAVILHFFYNIVYFYI